MGVWAVRIASWQVGAWVSYAYVTSSWIPGLVFAAVVLIWHRSAAFEFSVARHALFVAASIVNYKIVLTIAEAGAPASLDFNLFEPSVVVGSVLLPFVHGFLFEIAVKRILIAIPVIYLSAYVVASAGAALGPIMAVVNPVAIWQLAYLLVLCPASTKDASRVRSD